MSQVNPKDYIEKFSEFTKKAQEPLQAFAELNMKTLQNVKYMKPDDYSKIKNPEDFIEKQLYYGLENSRQALDYLGQSLKIFERSLLSMVNLTKEKASA